MVENVLIISEHIRILRSQITGNYFIREKIYNDEENVEHCYKYVNSGQLEAFLLNNKVDDRIIVRVMKKLNLDKNAKE